MLNSLEEIYTKVQPSTGLYIDMITNNDRKNVLKTFSVNKKNYSANVSIFGLFKTYREILNDVPNFRPTIDDLPNKINFYLINLLAHMIKYHDNDKDNMKALNIEGVNMKTLNIEGVNIPQLIEEIENNDMKELINNWHKSKPKQAGGRYKEKYLKYKTKYLNLKQII